MASDIEYRDQQSNTTSGLTTDTFTAMGVGPAAGDRYVVVCGQGRTSGLTAFSVTGVTIGGVTAVVTQQSNVVVNANLCWTAVALVPTGTTATVVVNYSRSRLRASVQSFSLTGANGTPTATYSSTAAAPTASINVPAGGCAVASAITVPGAPGTVTWTGLTERFDAMIGGVSLVTSASDNFASAQTGRTVTATFTASAESAMVVLAFGPATVTTAPDSAYWM